MTRIKARLLPPHGNYSGNVLWKRDDLAGHESQLQDSLVALRNCGYWVSSFPEGDGFTFQCSKKTDSELLEDIQKLGPWLDLTLANSAQWSLEAADMEDSHTHRCTVMVPLSKILLEHCFDLGAFRFVCPYELDPEPSERLANYQEAYLQFEADFEYRDLLRASAAIPFSDKLIRKCLTIAEHGLDLIRFEHSSFIRPEYTPNPAGLRSGGFYGVEIVPNGFSPLKDMSLQGMVAPLTTTNNHLGPDLGDHLSVEVIRLAELLKERNDELADAVRRTLRACRQSFYSLGDETRFLNLVFALDGLVGLDKKWTGWYHRTYVAAVLSGGDSGCFERILTRYDDLYSRVRNPLVHGGHDFYQLGEDPRVACEFLHDGIKDVINLITELGLTSKAQLNSLALTWLCSPAIRKTYTKFIISSPKGRAKEVPSWATQ